MFWQFVLEIPTGAIADKLGRKFSIALGGLGTSLCFLIYSLKPNLIFFLIAEFLASLGGSLVHGADKALIYDKLRQLKRTREAKHVFSNYTIASTLGIIISLPIGSYIADATMSFHPNNYSFVMALSSVPVFISFLIPWFIKEPKIKSHKENYFLIMKNGLKYFLTHKILRLLALDLALVSSTTFFIFWLYQPLLINSGIDIKYFGFVASAFNIFEIVLLKNLKLIEKKFDNRKIIFLTAAVPSLMFVILGLTDNIILIIFGLFLIVGLRDLRRPIFEHYMNKLMPSKQRATVLSSINMLERLIMTLIYPVVGFLVDKSLSMALIVLGLVTFALSITSKVTKDMVKD